MIWQGKQMILKVAGKPKFAGMAAGMSEAEINRVRKDLLLEITTNPAPVRSINGKDRSELLVRVMDLVWPNISGFKRNVDFEDVQ